MATKGKAKKRKARRSLSFKAILLGKYPRAKDRYPAGKRKRLKKFVKAHR